MTLLYMMIDLVSDSINWNMFARWSGSVVEWIECGADISGVRGSLSSGKPSLKCGYTQHAKCYIKAETK